jgi:outer membrane protein OmpA-like peptidoglycan-associated protein
MSRPALVTALAASLVCATALSGCLTPHVKPALSQAVVQARAGAGAKPAACPAGDLATISPLVLGFGFDEATVAEMDHKSLAAAALWLTCNPHVEVTIAPDADRHGDAAHLDDLARRRGQAVLDELRSLGAKDAVIHLLPRAAADPVSAPHLLISAKGRGW